MKIAKYISHMMIKKNLKYKYKMEKKMKIKLYGESCTHYVMLFIAFILKNEKYSPEGVEKEHSKYDKSI